MPAGDLRDGQDQPLDPRNGDLYHLRKSGLVQTIPWRDGDRALVVLTECGQRLLETNRRPSSSRHRHQHNDGRERHERPRQEFYGGLRKPKELTHDAQVYRAYLKAAERLRDEGWRELSCCILSSQVPYELAILRNATANHQRNVDAPTCALS